VTDQVSHPYKTSGKRMVFILQSLSFWRGNLKKKGSEQTDSKNSPYFICS